MEQVLRDFVEKIAANGINQHSAEWHLAKRDTIGGSTIATIMGLNPYSSIRNVIMQKVGLEKFGGDIKTRWGNLFEDVIKEYMEGVYGAKIYGENIYYADPGSPVAYSPDGMCVRKFGREERICLLEFKCPYSRIPSKKTPPAYYVPQVKMGLDILKLPTVGTLVEAVFRQCTRADFNNGSVVCTPIPRGHPRAPLAKGVVVFWCNSTEMDHCDRDLAAEDVSALGDLLELMERGEVKTRHRITSDADPELVAAELYPAGCTRLGYLPWKLLLLAEHMIEKTDQFLAPYMDKIREIDAVVRAARDADEVQKICIVEDYLSATAEDNYI